MVLAGILQPVGDLLVLGLVLGMGAFGYRHGLFLATLSGFALLAANVLALAASGAGAGLAVSLGCPEAYALPAVFAAVFAGCLAGVRLLVGAVVPENALRLPPLFDAIGGALVGAVAGVSAAGGLLVALSLAPVPADYRIDGAALKFDCGQKMLDTYAFCIEGDPARRQARQLELTRQYQSHAWAAQAAAGPAGAAAAGPAGQAPLISMPDEVALPADLADGGTLVQVRTVRQGEAITFALRRKGDSQGEFDLLKIDPQTGDITVPDVQRLRAAGRSLEIVVTSTDPAGLTDEKTVTIRLPP